MKKPPAVSTFEIHWKPLFRALALMVLAYLTIQATGWVVDRLPSSVQGVLGIVLIGAILRWLYKAYLDAEKKKAAKAKKDEAARKLFADEDTRQAIEQAEAGIDRLLRGAQGATQ